MKLEIPRYAVRAIEILESAGFEAYFVGGCVRDSLLGNKPEDWDIATNALPEQLGRVFRGFHVLETGLRHGTVTVVFEGHPLEITTYRIDGVYADSRRPEQVIFTDDIKRDLKRRDFTVNAMAYHPERGLIDEFGGRQDLDDRVIRCVGEPKQRLREDALRILRGLRFASVLDFSIERQTAAALHEEKERLAQIAAERIQTELVKLLCGQAAKRVLLEYRDVLAQTMPELEPTFDFDQKNPHHYLDVWTHTAEAIGNSAPVLAVRLALLFHDLGKPSCFTLDEKGIGHFYGHPEVSERLAGQILNRLRFDNETTGRVLSLVRWHDSDILPEGKSVKRWLNRLGETDLRLLLMVKAADRSATTHKYENLSVLHLVEQKIDRILEERQCFRLEHLQIGGNDLLQLGVPEGKQVGEILQTLLQAVIDERLPNQRTILKKRAAELWQKIK